MAQIVFVNPVIPAAQAVFQAQGVLHVIPLNLDTLVTQVLIVYVWIDTIILECRLAALAILSVRDVQITHPILVLPAILFLLELFQVVLVFVWMGFTKLLQLWNYVRYVHILALLAHQMQLTVSAVTHLWTVSYQAILVLVKHCIFKTLHFYVKLAILLALPAQTKQSVSLVLHLKIQLSILQTSVLVYLVNTSTV